MSLENGELGVIAIADLAERFDFLSVGGHHGFHRTEVSVHFLKIGDGGIDPASGDGHISLDPGHLSGDRVDIGLRGAGGLLQGVDFVRHLNIGVLDLGFARMDASGQVRRRFSRASALALPAVPWAWRFRLFHFVADRIERLLPLDLGGCGGVAQVGGFGIELLARLRLIGLDRSQFGFERVQRADRVEFHDCQSGHAQEQDDRCNGQLHYHDDYQTRQAAPRTIGWPARAGAMPPGIQACSR